MKETGKLIIVLTLICFGAGMLLSYVNRLTAAPIEQAQRAEKLAAIRAVLPAFDNEPDRDTLTIEFNATERVLYIARKAGKTAGAALETVAPQGYGGAIRLIVGIDAAGKVQAIEILDHKETPGLGAKIEEAAFKDQFKGKPIRDTNWAVRKDQGDIDEITAATISSRVVVAAVYEALQAYLANEEAILNGSSGG